jgi:hypothetical protein
MKKIETVITDLYTQNKNKINFLFTLVGLSLYRLQNLEFTLNISLYNEHVSDIRKIIDERIYKKYDKMTMGIKEQNLESKYSLDEKFIERLKNLIKERNWLVHNSMMNVAIGCLNDNGFIFIYNRLIKINVEIEDIEAYFIEYFNHFGLYSILSKEEVDRNMQTIIDNLIITGKFN